MVRIPTWEQSVSNLPGASNVPHATPDTFGYQIGRAQEKAGAQISAGFQHLGGVLSDIQNEQDAVAAKTTLSDHETAVNLEKLRLQQTTPAADHSRIPDTLNEFARNDWAERSGSIGGKYNGIATAQAHTFWNRLYLQNQVEAIKSYHSAVSTQIGGAVDQRAALVFADPTQRTAAASAISSMVFETKLPPEAQRQMLEDAGSKLTTQIYAGYDQRALEAYRKGQFETGNAILSEKQALTKTMPAELSRALGIDRLPKPVPPPILSPNAPLPSPPTMRQPGQQPERQQLQRMNFVPVESGKPMEIAKSLLGAHERENKDVIAKFIGNVGGKNVDPATTAWCAAFVNAVLRQSGNEGTNSLMARSFLKYGTPVENPQVGDIVVLARGRPGSGSGHVGFYAGSDDNGIKVLGGNQGDRVSIAHYSEKAVLAYRRVEGRQVAAAGMGYF
jgi:uncharacterized protein (TIGR02594 family)